VSAPRLVGLGTAQPDTRYTQTELYAHSPWEPTPLLDRLFLESAVQSRGLFIPPEWYRSPRTLTETNAAWREGALLLGGRALEGALQQAGVVPEQIDHLGVTTVTGYTTPGLDLLLAKDHGLRPDIARAHFNCIGCHAAVPLLRAATEHVIAHPDHTAVAVAVEVCSACFAEDDDPQNLVALSLFGDGAAGAVVAMEGSGPEILGFGSRYAFDHIDALGFELGAQGFRIVLDPSIPGHIAHAIEGTVLALLEGYGLSTTDVEHWCFHPGGARILDAAQRALGLSDLQLRSSRRVLRAAGNMSSPSVLFVLQEELRNRTPKAGSYGVMAAFGPGLGIEVGLLRF
jgi:alkylresorcinol/alkylpyrone synthase